MEIARARKELRVYHVFTFEEEKTNVQNYLVAVDLKTFIAFSLNNFGVAVAFCLYMYHFYCIDNVLSKRNRVKAN